MKGVISMSGKKMYSTELKLEMAQYYITVPFNIEKTGDVNYAKRI